MPEPRIDFDQHFPGGDEIFFAFAPKGAGGLYRKSANGAGQERLVLQTANAGYPTDVSSDGKYLLYGEFQGSNDIFVLPLDGDRKPTPFVVTPAGESHAKFSPDGHWVVYQSNESGRFLPRREAGANG